MLLRFDPKSSDGPDSDKLSISLIHILAQLYTVAIMLNAFIYIKYNISLSEQTEYTNGV